MRIAIAAEYPYHEGEIKGGISNVVYNLIEGYKHRKEDEIVILALTVNEERSFAVMPHIHVQFLHIPGLPQTINALLYEASIIKKEIQKRQPDIVHCHNMTGYTIGSIRSGCPCLITPHGDWIAEQKHNHDGNRLKTGIKVFIWERIYSYIFRTGKYFSAISPYVEELIRHYNQNAEIYRIPNPLSDAYRTAIPSCERQNRILWAGRICKLKRLDLAVEIFQRIHQLYPEYIYEVAGQADANTQTSFDLLRQKAILSLGSAIIFHGHLQRNEMIQAYDRAKVLLLTSEQEASPMVIIEAMARGCVPVTFDLPGIRHLVTDGYNGVIVPERNEELVVARLTTLINDAGLFSRMSAQCIETSKQYAVDAIIDRYVASFKRICNAEAK